MHLHTKLVGLLVGMALAQGAAAQDWWLVAKTGAKPQRQAFYADLSSLTPQADLQALQAGRLVEVHQIDTRLVTQASAQTQELARSYVVDCDQSRAALAKGVEIGRDGLSLAELPKPWERVEPGGAMWPLVEFVCESVGKMSAAGKQGRDITATASKPPLEHAWAVLWPDANEPEPTTPSAQREALAKQRVAQLEAYIRQQDAAYLKGSNSAAFDKAAATARQSRSVDRQHEVWIGASEVQLVSEMGKPSEFSIRNGVRSLVYASSYETTQIYRYWGWYSRGLIISPETRWCRTTYYATQGRVFDYSVNGNDCQ